MVFGSSSLSLTPFTFGALLSVIKVSKQFTKGLNCETNLCNASYSQRVGAAFNNVTFFRPSTICAAPNAEALTEEYFISFHTASIKASTSVTTWNFEIKCTNRLVIVAVNIFCMRYQVLRSLL